MPEITTLEASDFRGMSADQIARQQALGQKSTQNVLAIVNSLKSAQDSQRNFDEDVRQNTLNLAFKQDQLDFEKKKSLADIMIKKTKLDQDLEIDRMKGKQAQADAKALKDYRDAGTALDAKQKDINERLAKAQINNQTLTTEKLQIELQETKDQKRKIDELTGSGMTVSVQGFPNPVPLGTFVAMKTQGVPLDITDDPTVKNILRNPDTKEWYAVMNDGSTQQLTGITGAEVPTTSSVTTVISPEERAEQTEIGKGKGKVRGTDYINSHIKENFKTDFKLQQAASKGTLSEAQTMKIRKSVAQDLKSRFKATTVYMEKDDTGEFIFYAEMPDGTIKRLRGDI